MPDAAADRDGTIDIERAIARAGDEVRWYSRGISTCSEPFEVLASSPAPDHVLPDSATCIEPFEVVSRTSPDKSVACTLPLLVSPRSVPVSAVSDTEPFDELAVVF